MSNTEAYDTATTLIQQLNALARQEAAKRFSGTDTLYGETSLELNLWLMEKMKETNLLLVTELTPEMSHLYYKLKDVGVVIDRVTGCYLLRGETTIRKTTMVNINQLVFTLHCLYNTPLRHLQLKQEFVSDDTSQLYRDSSLPF